MKEKKKRTKKIFERYIPFTSDYGFKATFGNESDTRFLCLALQALIKSLIPIVGIQFIKNTAEGETIYGRGGIYDIACTDANGDIFIIEMQVAEFLAFLQRMKFYGSQRILPFIKQGVEFKFEGLPKIYVIGIVDTQIYDDDRYYRCGRIRDETGTDMDDRADYIIIELGKFTKKTKDCISNLDKLLYTMKEAHNIKKDESIPTFMGEDWLGWALHELDTKNMSVRDYTELQIAVAREYTRRHRHEQVAAAAEARGEAGSKKAKQEAR